MASDSKDSEGNSNYYVDKLRYNSNFIFWTNHDSSLSESGSTFSADLVVHFVTHDLPITSSMTNGADGYRLSSGEKYSAYNTIS